MKCSDATPAIGIMKLARIGAAERYITIQIARPTGPMDNGRPVNRVDGMDNGQ